MSKTFAQNEREMELDEWCAELPPNHAVNRELRALRSKEAHPLRWWWRRTVRRLKERISACTD